MQNAKQGDFKLFDASQWQIGIVVAQFNQNITQGLHESTLKRAKAYSIPDKNIDSILVAGAVEIPLALQHMAKQNHYQALVAIGCVIKGDTAHFDYVAKFVTDGVLRVQLDFHIPIAFGVLTCNNEAQALERTHLGSEFLDAVLHQAKFIND